MRTPLSFLIASLLGTCLFGAPPPSLESFRHLVRHDTWTEKWPDPAAASTSTSGAPGLSRQVTAELWTEAIHACLDAHGAVHIPARAEPYYIDGPLVLRSGQHLHAHPTAEIRLRPGTNTCMVRNASLLGFPDGPVPTNPSIPPDTGITIQGGIWTTLANGVPGANGNLRGASSKDKPVPGTHGVILLQHVRNVRVEGITVRRSRAFAVHLANAHDFVVDGVVLEDHGRDGVHVNGPSSHGRIRQVGGQSHDDTVALNAWEWKNYAPSYGPIHHITIEHIHGAPQGLPSADSIRLLPGVKTFPDGTTLDCPIHDIVIRDITGIREYKCYDQPNLELGRDRDFSAAVGTLRNIRLERLQFTRPGAIEIHAQTDGLTIHDADLRHPPLPGHFLVRIGPKSHTYKGADPGNAARWTEIFSPDRDCTVRGLDIARVRQHHPNGRVTDLVPDEVVQVIQLTPNARYPETIPRGGSGRGILIR